MVVDYQVGQELGNRPCSHRLGVPLVLEYNEPSHPADTGPIGAHGQMPDSNLIGQLVKEFLLGDGALVQARRGYRGMAHS